MPPYMRRSPKVSEVLPLLYLHGLSSGDFVPALTEFFGTEAGLSSATIVRLTKQWQQERERFMKRDLSRRAGGTTFRSGSTVSIQACGWVLRTACVAWSWLVSGSFGTKELVALSEGYRESTESWAELLRDLKRRGMRAPAMAVGDGALGF